MAEEERRPSSRKKAEAAQSELERKARKLKELAKGLGQRFHGRREESLEKVRARGLKAKETHEGLTVFSDAEAADLSVYSSGKKHSVVHSVPEDYIGKRKQEGAIAGEDYYAGHVEKHVHFDIPPERIKTFVMNVRREPMRKLDPLLSAVEKKLNADGMTMKQAFAEDPRELHRKITYYSLLLAEDAYDRHREDLAAHVEQQLAEDGYATFQKTYEKASELGIIPDIQDHVIGSVFLDMGLKKAKEGFVKK